MTPDTLSQPRILSNYEDSNYEDSNLNKASLLNVAFDDMPNEMSYELRLNIIRNANEVYHLGTKSNLEYAKILNSLTGKTIHKNPIVQQNEGKIYLAESIFKNKHDNHLSIIHNHTNKSHFSDYDITTLIRRKCVKDIYLASDKRLLRVAQNNDLLYSIYKVNIDSNIRKLAIETKNKNYLFAGCGDYEFEKIKEIFSNHGLLLERW